MSKIRDFIATFPTRSFERNQLILCQNEPSNSVYFVKKGFIKGFDISNQGSEQMVWFGAKGDFFPAINFSESDIDTAFFYGAFSDAEVFSVNKLQLMNHLRDNNESLYEITTQLSMRYFDMLQGLNAAVKPKAGEKIVHMLKLIASRFSFRTKNGHQELSLPLTHQDIANLLGLTRETVAVELKRLKDEGYLHYDKWHFIVFPEKLDLIAL